MLLSVVATKQQLLLQVVVELPQPTLAAVVVAAAVAETQQPVELVALVLLAGFPPVQPADFAALLTLSDLAAPAVPAEQPGLEPLLVDSAAPALLAD